MKLNRAFFVLVVAGATAAGGCSHSIVSTDSDMGVDAGPDMAHVIPMGCSGGVQGSVYLMFSDCTVGITQDTGEVMRITPAKYKGDALYKALFAVRVIGTFQVKSYTLADLDRDTVIEFITQDQMKHYSAGKDSSGVTTGDVKLELYSPPTPPANGLNAWMDTTVHGTLTATLVHDPATPGMDPDPQVFTASF